MTTEDWFKKFDTLRRSDFVNFDGLRLQVGCIMTFGGCAFRGGEIIPISSPLWDSAIIEGKEVNWVDPDKDELDPADWWK